jgi:hypothetical protein
MGLYANPQSRTSKTSQNDTPKAIYIPSQAVRANLDFLKSFTSSAEIWKNAPTSVRQTSNEAFSRSYHRLQTRQQPHSNDQPTSPVPDGSFQSKGNPSTSDMPTNTKLTHTPAQQTDPFNEQPRADDATIETLASTTSRTTAFFSAQTTRFQELEAQIKQNHKAY